MNKNNEKRLTIIIIVLIIVIVGLSGFIAVDKFLLEDNSKNKTENPSSTNKPIPLESPKPTQGEDIQEPGEEEVEISMELAEKLYRMVYDDLECGFNLFSYYKYNKITPDTFSNEFKNTVVARRLYERDADKINNNQKEPIYTNNEILQMKNSIFGENTSFEIVNKKDCGEFQKLEDDNYKINIGCGNMCTQTAILKISKASKNKSIVRIDQKVIFEDSKNHINDAGMTSYYYQNADRTILLGKRDFLNSMDYLDNYNNIDWNQYENQASVYRYTFQDNSDGTFTFLQIEKLNK